MFFYLIKYTITFSTSLTSCLTGFSTCEHVPQLSPLTQGTAPLTFLILRAVTSAGVFLSYVTLFSPRKGECLTTPTSTLTMAGYFFLDLDFGMIKVSTSTSPRSSVVKSLFMAANTSATFGLPLLTSIPAAIFSARAAKTA